MMKTLSIFKPSLYNVFGSLNNTEIIANTFTGAIIKTNYEGIKIAKLLQNNPALINNYYHEDFITTLIQNGFLIKSDVDEKKLLEERFKLSKATEKSLGIAITTTLQCNFRCIYCYEQYYESKSFEEKVFKNVINYVTKNKNGKELLKIIWWGGEPLLEINRIKKYSKEFIKIAEKYNLKYESSIVTNGYLLDEKTAKVLNKCNVKTAQITLDGYGEAHNQRRKLIGGKETYKTILSNLRNNVKMFDLIILRINIDKRNVKGLDKLLEDLFPMRKKLSLTLRPVTIPIKNASPQWMFDVNEFSKILLEFAIKAYSKGFRLFFGHIDPGTTFCNAYHSLNNFSIDPDGSLQICPVFTGNESDRFGFLTQDGKIVHNKKSIQYQWLLSKIPFDDPLCMECKALPICMGSCFLEGNKQYRCLPKYNMAELMYIREKSLLATNTIKDNFEVRIISGKH